MRYFITFEGGEGAGKSTQLRRLAEYLNTRGVPNIATREPGGSPEAEFLRGVLLSGKHDFSPITEMILHFAARAEHITRTIRPALEDGIWVLSDRFFDTTQAYQVYGQGANCDAYYALRQLMGLQPDLTFILDVSPKVAAAREEGRGRAADRYDRLGSEFHARVAAGFRAIAESEPHRCILLNADQDEFAVSDKIRQIVDARFFS